MGNFLHKKKYKSDDKYYRDHMFKKTNKRLKYIDYGDHYYESIPLEI